MLRFALALAASLLGIPALARPQTIDWVPNNPAVDGPSCVATCARNGGAALSAGTIAYPSSGDPSLYICKAFVPGGEVFGERAGYNWNGYIGANVQPGCTVVGGSVGYSHVPYFECLCDVGEGDVRVIQPIRR